MPFEKRRDSWSPQISSKSQKLIPAGMDHMYDIRTGKRLTIEEHAQEQKKTEK